MRGNLTIKSNLGSAHQPGVYFLLPNGQYEGVPSSFDPALAYWLSVEVYGEGDEGDTGRWIKQSLISLQTMNAGTSAAMKLSFERRMDRKNPMNSTASNAWDRRVPVFSGAGADLVAAKNIEAQREFLDVCSKGQTYAMRGTVPVNTDLGLIWAPGLYYLSVNGNYGSFPSAADPTLAYFLEVGNPGTQTGSDEGGGNRFYEQTIRSLGVLGSETGRPYRATYSRRADRSNPTTTSGANSWTIVSPQQKETMLAGTYAFIGDSMTAAGIYPEVIAASTGITALKLGFAGCNMAVHKRADPLSQYYDALCMYRLARYIATGDYREGIKAADDLYANGGTDMRQFVESMAATNWNSVKTMCIFFGTNDFGSLVPLGEDSDVTPDGSTFKGSINYIIETLMTAFPHMNLAFITPPFRWRITTSTSDSDVTPNAAGFYLTQYVDAVLELARKHKVRALDLYRTSGINKFNHAFMLPDGLHPGNGATGGKARVASVVGGFLLAGS